MPVFHVISRYPGDGQVALQIEDNVVEEHVGAFGPHHHAAGNCAGIRVDGNIDAVVPDVEFPLLFDLCRIFVKRVFHHAGCGCDLGMPEIVERPGDGMIFLR